MKSLGPLMLIVVAIAGFFFYVDPQYNKVKQLNAEIDANKEVIEIANKLKTRKEELTTRYDQISQSEKSELEKLLPESVDNVRLIIDINNIASQFGIVIRDISVQSKESKSSEPRKVTTPKSNFDNVIEEGSIKYADGNKIGVISFSFSVSAKYEVFLEFLKQLEASLRLIDIRNIEISRGNGSFYNYKVTFDTYWLK